jgi:precorrin-2/cobalt-factor-2 C20-methyltransferase
MTPKLGTLYGIGAGPGAPDLLTLRAKQVIERVPVLALPRASDHARSTAWRIVEPAVNPPADQKRLFLTFPMSKDPARVKPAVERACDAMQPELEAGRDVAFVSEGDPSTFSTFIYVRQELLRRLPQLQVEVVPGVSSIMAVPAVAGVALADGHERVAILPGTSGLDDLERTLQHFDTIVLMKVGPELPQLKDRLRAAGLLEHAVYVSRATMEDQHIERDLSRVDAERGDCFTMVVIKKPGQSGVLIGESEARPYV